MSQLPIVEHARRQRAVWICFIHERFAALIEYNLICLEPLPDISERDPSSPWEIHQWLNCIIQSFLLVDQDFVDLFWHRRTSGTTSHRVQPKNSQLEDEHWYGQASVLPGLQRADLIITRQWLRTVIWQIALFNVPLTSNPDSQGLSLVLPLYLSHQLRQLLLAVPRDAVNLHWSGVLDKLFDITNTIADVIFYLPNTSTDDTRQWVKDIVLEVFHFLLLSYSRGTSHHSLG